MAKRMNSTQFVESLSDKILLQMIVDHELFMQQGFSFDTELRKQAETFVYQLGAPGENIVHWMDRLMFDVYRNFAMRYIKMTVGE